MAMTPSHWRKVPRRKKEELWEAFWAEATNKAPKENNLMTSMVERVWPIWIEHVLRASMNGLISQCLYHMLSGGSSYLLVAIWLAFIQPMVSRWHVPILDYLLRTWLASPFQRKTKSNKNCIKLQGDKSTSNDKKTLQNKLYVEKH